MPSISLRGFNLQAESDEEEIPSRQADPDMELQVTFGGGLDELREKLEAKREELAQNGGKDTLWEAYLKRRRQGLHSKSTYLESGRIIFCDCAFYPCKRLLDDALLGKFYLRTWQITSKQSRSAGVVLIPSTRICSLVEVGVAYQSLLYSEDAFM